MTAHRSQAEHGTSSVDGRDDDGSTAVASRTTDDDSSCHPFSSSSPSPSSPPSVVPGGPSRSGGRRSRTVAVISVLSAAAFVGTTAAVITLGGSSSSSHLFAAITPHVDPSYPRSLRMEERARARAAEADGGRRELMQSSELAMVETDGGTTMETETEMETDAQKAIKVKGTLSAIKQEKEFLREQIALAGGSPVDAGGGGGETSVGSSGVMGVGSGSGGEKEIRPPTAAAQKKQSAKSAVQVQYGLAKGQSFGFFNDVPDDTWERLRRRALDQPRHDDANADDDDHPLADADRPHRWYGSNWEPNFTCANERRVGGLTAPDGPKWVCNPHRIGTYSRERVAGGGPGCLVYSFGSMGFYGFEEGLLDVTSKGKGGDGDEDDGRHPGCEVHVFEENPPRDDDGNVKDPPPGIVLHPWGLKPENDDDGGSSSSSSGARDPKNTYKSLRETVETLGHRHRVVDVFKIDCEGCEWGTYDDWFTSGLDIRQLLVETHGVPENANDFFERLRSEGYVTFHKEPNTWSAGGACQEYAFLKLDQGFFRRH